MWLHISYRLMFHSFQASDGMCPWRFTSGLLFCYMIQETLRCC